MINNEIYWTEEYILYAEMVEKKQQELSAKINEEQNLQEPQEEEKENSEC